MKRSFLLALGLLCLGSSVALAQTTELATEDFSYTDGSSLTSEGWNSHSGTAGDLLVSGGQAVVQHGAPSEDAHLQFASVNTGILRAAFDITVNDDTTIGGGTDFEYFAHFMTSGSFDFRSRLDIQAPTGTGQYTLGISSATSTAEATLTNDFNFGDVVSVILDFDLDTGTGSLTVGGETIFGSANGGQALDSFALRQSDSSNNESILVDNLVVSNITAVPEPSSMGVLALAGLAFLRRKRS